MDIAPPKKKNAKLTFIRQDIREPMAHLLQQQNVDTVVHTAYILPPLHDKKRMEDININGSKNVLEACQSISIKHLLYTSSATAYGFHQDNPVPMKEDQPLRGNEDFTYAKNKKEIEKLFASFMAENKHIKVTVLRPCFVIGPTINNPVSRLIAKPISILPKEHSPIQFVHEDDLTRAILHCLINGHEGIYNIGGEGALTFPEMARALGNKTLEIPFPLVKLLNDIAWKLRLKWLTESPSAGLGLVRYPWIVSSQKFINQTEFSFQYNSKQAFDAFISGL